MRDRILLFVFLLNWLIADIVTYNISFSVGKLKGSIFYNGMLLGVSDFMSNLSVSCLANFSG